MPEESELGLKAWLSGGKTKKETKGSIEKPPLDRHRLAVLPFVNISPDPADAYLADGMTEELITAVSRLQGLQVIARTSVANYREGSTKLSTIANELRVGTVLEGSVRKAGNRIRVTAQCIDVATESHLWSEKYDRDLDDVFRIQDDIAGRIADALRVKLATTHGPGPKRMESIEAYTLYLKGRSLWNKRTRDPILESLKVFLEAIKLDPEYAKAWSGLADAYIIAADHDYVDRNEGLSKAREAARKALELDYSLAEPHVSLGQVFAVNLEFDEAQKQFKLALELNPNYATAHHWYANLLSDLGRINDSVDEIRRARELDPLSPTIALVAGIRLTYLGKLDDAIAEYDKIIEREPGYSLAYGWRSIAYGWKHEREPAFADLEAWHKILRDENYYRIVLAGLHAWFGERDKAQQLMSEQLQNAEKSRLHSYLIALDYAILGDADEFFAWIDKALAMKFVDVKELRYSRFYDKVRNDPRFPEIFRKLKLPY